MGEFLTIKTIVDADINDVWTYWTRPEHIVEWNYASEDWHTTKASNDLRSGGVFSSRMEAKDGSMGFDFGGKHLEVVPNKSIESMLGDGRKMKVIFEKEAGKTIVTESFEAEEENPVEMQRVGWQSILDNFREYVEHLQFRRINPKIQPYLWFDNEAADAVKWYVSLFDNSKILNESTLSDTPSGEVQIIEFQLANLRMNAMSAGPDFVFNPSVSLMVSCETPEEVDKLHAQFINGGSELMPLGEYPFSRKYAWVQDKYGLNWQLFTTNNADYEKKIRPNLLFSVDACGRAGEAMEFYQTVFKKVEKGFVNPYTLGEAEDARAKINYAEMNIEGLQLVMMDHGSGGEDAFNEAFSFMISCADQEEIDYFWERLSFVPEAEQCGWVKDKFGVSWQIVPENMDDFFTGTEEEAARVMAAMLKMKKLDIGGLINAKYA